MMLTLAAGDLLARAKDGEGVKSGPWGLAIILVLCVACYFLFKSMSKHMRKVREEFPSDDVQPPSTSGNEAGPVRSEPLDPGTTPAGDPVAKAPPADPA